MSLPHLLAADESSVVFLTLNAVDGYPAFNRASYVIPLIDSINYYRFAYRLLLLGYVVMPNHLHLLVWPEDLACLGDLMRDFKGFTSRRIQKQAQVEGDELLLETARMAAARLGRGRHKIWQDDFWDTIVFTPRVVAQKLRYMHHNPVRAGLVREPGQWPYSSFRNYESGDHSLITVDIDAWFRLRGDTGVV